MALQGKKILASLLAVLLLAGCTQQPGLVPGTLGPQRPTGGNTTHISTQPQQTLPGTVPTVPWETEPALPTEPVEPTVPAVPGVEESPLLITEVMASNQKTVADEFGQYSDWIELHNTTAEEISLKGYYLSDSEGNLTKYALPDVTIAGGGYLVVYASDLGTVTENGQIHTNFKISAGEMVFLSFEGAPKAWLTVSEDLPADFTNGLLFDGESWLHMYFATPTPGAENGGVYAQVLSQMPVSGSGLQINEFMMRNSGILYDENGDCPDWVEIKNTADHPVSLAGFGLSDVFAEPLKWRFPDITLEPGAYLLVLLSGKDKVYTAGDPYLHAGFKLGAGDAGLRLSDSNGLPVDQIDTVALPENTSYGRDPAEPAIWKFYARPTPGKANGANGFTELSGAQTAMVQKVYINEVCAVSSGTVSGLAKEDWIELYNNTGKAVNLAGWSLSKYISDLRFFTFPDVTIPARGYLVIQASGTVSYSKKSLDAGFKVGRTGDTLYLVDADGLVTDAFDTGLQRSGVTSGRAVVDHKLVRRFYTTPTKGKANKDGSEAYALPVTMVSDAGALMAQCHTVTMTTLQPGATIYYTTDGTVPTRESNVYTQPLILAESASVRAVAYADGLLPSQVTTQTFLISKAHKLNVVCLTCDPADLFSDEKGIWANGPGYTEEYPHTGANFWKDWEREVFFEYYEFDGTLGVAFSAGMKNHGQYSRAQAQRSVSINLKEAYGSSTTHYPFFGEGELAAFDNLVLRTGGQDWNYTNLIDAYCARVIDGQMDLDHMRDLPVAVYVNGQYWGMYYIRDKINESYVKYNQGIEEDNLDMIKGNTIVQTGSYDAHGALLEYIKTHDLSEQEAFDYVATQIDLEEWTNYWITQSFFANTDTGNIRFYCSKDGGGKWRWILFDLDWAMYPSTYTWNMISAFQVEKGHGVGNAFSTVIARGLLSNEGFKTYFIEQYAKYMQTVFAPERLLAIWDAMVDQVDEEMMNQCSRWNAISYSKWKSNVTYMRKMLQNRWNYCKEDLQETFGLSDEYMAQLFSAESE